MSTKIEWCDETVNPVIGCSKISEGCENCVAELFAKRGMCEQHRKARDWNGGFSITWADGQLEKVAKWKKPRKIFIGLMTDLFHVDVSFPWMLRIMDCVESNPHHTFMMLTKRPALMRLFFEINKPPENLWLGVSAENQERAEQRIPILLEIPAKVHFASCEPLLGPIDYSTLSMLKWVIAGPETGRGARPCDPEWIDQMAEDCRQMGTPFFDKRKEGYTRREFPV